jgi:hypothetical protein
MEGFGLIGGHWGVNWALIWLGNAETYSLV